MFVMCDLACLVDQKQPRVPCTVLPLLFRRNGHTTLNHVRVRIHSRIHSREAL